MKSGLDRVSFVPIRHHSPACALAVRAAARDLRPCEILIEGPHDFTPQMDQLALPHRLPIAIYSYIREADGATSGAYYPFCRYSPEWQALEAARELGVPARFIDLPWAGRLREEEEVEGEDQTINAFAEPQLRRSRYIDALCEELGVDDFDALWDELFEVDPPGPPWELLNRVALFSAHSRETDPAKPSDRRREAFMAARIREVLDATEGPLLVVTGAYHVTGLEALLREGVPEDAGSLEPLTEEAREAGIALTPYSYERLDALTGYQAGMPGPGFYDTAWTYREKGEPLAHNVVIRAVVDALRRLKQTVSTADLIAVEIEARALAALRGHQQVWRRDIIDGLRSALIKDEVARGGYHPLLDAVDEVFRGTARGVLAEGTARPPLVDDIEQQLTGHNLLPTQGFRDLELDLMDEAPRRRSRILHRLAILGIAGFNRTDGTDMAAREGLHRIWERWRISWNPEYASSQIEAAVYGPTLAAASSGRLKESIAKSGTDLAAVARLLIRAALAGLGEHAAELMARAVGLAHRTEEFLVAGEALSHLLYLYAYDRVLEFARKERLLPLIGALFERSLWLLESLGNPGAKARPYAEGVAGLVRVFERCREATEWSENDLEGVLSRVQADSHQHPMIRGAATGALWELGVSDSGPIAAGLRYFSRPDQLGDYLTGLFILARETVQRQQALLDVLDAVLMGYTDEEFLEALPALRLAFTFFTPREKYYLAANLLPKEATSDEMWGSLEVPPETAAGTLKLEASLLERAARYGIDLMGDFDGDTETVSDTDTDTL